MSDNDLQIKELQDKLKYLYAVMDAQKFLCAVYDSHFSLESFNSAFQTLFIDGRLGSDFMLVALLDSYDKQQLPSTDKALIHMLESSDCVKAVFEMDGSGDIKEKLVLSLTLSRFHFADDGKYIITMSDITEQERVRKQEIELLKYREKYHNTQQRDAFKKQMKIIRDEVSHRDSYGWFFDSYYKPLDILSGDTYGSIVVRDEVYLFYVIDAMGKGLAASVTSIQSTSFINNAVDIALNKNDFNFEAIIRSFCAYIKKQLLDEELLCVTFILFDMREQKFCYASFGMPPILLESSKGDVVRLSPNNPPIMSFIDSNNVGTVDISDINKIAIFSDGFNESMTKSARLYDKFLENDFFTTDTLGNLVKKFSEKTTEFEDDITVIYMRQVEFKEKPEFEMLIESSKREIIMALEEIDTFLRSITEDEMQQASLAMSINELLMNAYEHGNLGISSEYKQNLLMADQYEKMLNELEKKPENLINKIFIGIYLSEELPNGTRLLKIIISDSGKGFNFSEAIKHANSPFNTEFRGRGIKMSLHSVGGIYYNSKGKKVTILDSIKYSSDKKEEK